MEGRSLASERGDGGEGEGEGEGEGGGDREDEGEGERDVAEEGGEGADPAGLRSHPFPISKGLLVSGNK